jgi:hypothetical protein
MAGHPSLRGARADRTHGGATEERRIRHPPERAWREARFSQPGPHPGAERKRLAASERCGSSPRWREHGPLRRGTTRPPPRTRRGKPLAARARPRPLRRAPADLGEPRDARVPRRPHEAKPGSHPAQAPRTGASRTGTTPTSPPGRRAPECPRALATQGRVRGGGVVPASHVAAVAWPGGDATDAVAGDAGRLGSGSAARPEQPDGERGAELGQEIARKLAVSPDQDTEIAQDRAYPCEGVALCLRRGCGWAWGLRAGAAPTARTGAVRRSPARAASRQGRVLCRPVPRPTGRAGVLRQGREERGVPAARHSHGQRAGCRRLPQLERRGAGRPWSAAPAPSPSPTGIEKPTPPWPALTSRAKSARPGLTNFQVRRWPPRQRATATVDIAVRKYHTISYEQHIARCCAMHDCTRRALAAIAEIDAPDVPVFNLRGAVADRRRGFAAAASTR